MSFHIHQAHPQAHFQASYSDEQFYHFIECLKSQKALPNDSFVQFLPFFNLQGITKEEQVMELFNQFYDQESYNALLKQISHDTPTTTTPTEETNMMTFAQICLYKVLPCFNPRCVKRPREIVTHNQYKDHEYECPFYHHERDRRRIIINSAFDDEFAYKANYFEERRSNAEKDKYSQNYFESMFHPLYYKMFRCKRALCNECKFCPFYHNEQEKKAWDRTFGDFMQKDRITYVKDKQRYYESTNNMSSEHQEVKSTGSTGSQSPKSSSATQQKKNKRHQKSPTTPNQYPLGKYHEYNSEVFRKESGDSFHLGNVPSAVFGYNRGMIAHRAS